MWLQSNKTVSIYFDPQIRHVIENLQMTEKENLTNMEVPTPLKKKQRKENLTQNRKIIKIFKKKLFKFPAATEFFLKYSIFNNI